MALYSEITNELKAGRDELASRERRYGCRFAL
jgi:hypothetical protein